MVFRQKDANGIANSEDPDQTAPRIRLLLESDCSSRSSLICVCTVCPDLHLSKNFGSLWKQQGQTQTS